MSTNNAGRRKSRHPQRSMTAAKVESRGSRVEGRPHPAPLPSDASERSRAAGQGEGRGNFAQAEKTFMDSSGDYSPRHGLNQNDFLSSMQWRRGLARGGSFLARRQDVPSPRPSPPCQRRGERTKDMHARKCLVVGEDSDRYQCRETKRRHSSEFSAYSAFFAVGFGRF